MKNKQKIMIPLLLLGLLAVLSGGFFLYSRQAAPVDFTGEWYLDNSKDTKQTLTIKGDGSATMLLSSTKEEIKTKYTFAESEINGNQLTLKVSDLTLLEQSYPFAEEDELYMDDEFVEPMTFFSNKIPDKLTKRELEKYMTARGDQIVLTINRLAVIREVLNVSIDTEIILQMAKDGQRLNMTNSESFDEVTFVKKFETMATSSNTSSNTSSESSSATETSSSDEGTINDFFNDYNKKEDELIYEPDKFAYYFLIQNNKVQRARFIQTYVAPEAQEMFKEHLEDEPLFPKAASGNIYSDERKYDDNLTYQIVHVHDELHYILKKNADGKILDVLGDGWTETSESRLQELDVFVRVRPIVTLRYFLVYYMDRPALKREENVTENPEYTTEECRKMLLERALEDIEPVEGASWNLSRFSDGSFAIIINEYKGTYEDDDPTESEPVYILALNKDSVLTHVYGGIFESLPEAEWNYVLENKEEENFVY